MKAFREGRVSLRQYDRLSRLSPLRQRKAVQLASHKEQAQTLAALTINSFLAQNPQRIDLAHLASRSRKRSVRSVRTDIRGFGVGF